MYHVLAKVILFCPIEDAVGYVVQLRLSFELLQLCILKHYRIQKPCFPCIDELEIPVEAVALKRQEELIREEEAAWQAESDQKIKRGVNEREKKSKKKQAKQKRNNRKGKDKGREERTTMSVHDKRQQDNAVDEKKDSNMEEAQSLSEKPDAMEDVSDVSDSVDGVTEMLHPESEDRDASPVNWDTDASEVHPTEAGNNGMGGVSSIQNGIGKIRGKASSIMGSWTNETDSQPSGSAADAGDINNDSGSGKVGETEAEGAVLSLQDRLKWAEQHVVRKEEEVLSLKKKPSIKDKVEKERLIDNESLQKEKISAETSSSGSQQTDKDPSSPFTSASQITNVSKIEVQKTSSARLTERSVARAPMMSRPSSAPLVPAPRPTAPVVSMVQSAPLLVRSVSAAGRLGPDPSPATHSHVPQSYRNAIIGNPVASTAASLTHSSSSSSEMDTNVGQSGVPFSMITQDVLQNGSQWIESSQRESSRSMQYDQASRLNDVQNHDLYRPLHSRSMGNMSTEFPACTSGRQNQALLVDEFPHLDIINDLLDDEHGVVKTAKAGSVFESLNNGPRLLNRHFTYSGDLGANDDLGSSTSSCRFERSQSYHHDHGFRGGYSSSRGHFDSLRDYVPQVSSVPYVNGQVDGLIPNQWQVAGSDLLYVGMRNTENDGYAYYPDYLNMACGVNGYTVFRPSNGP
ncbi:hypothetical protein SESBI_22750 [Sesbania bispinosa]|nr:hypothetical protein SESBI_22750 [Sesbania bispinosa]